MFSYIFVIKLLQVSSWIQHLIPKIEDGNDFGVAIQARYFFSSLLEFCNFRLFV